MNRYALAALSVSLLADVFALAFTTSCAHVPAPVVSCVADPRLVPEVAADLAAPDYEARLEALVARVGLCIVDRTVESVIAPAAEALAAEEALAPDGAAADAELIARGRAWLAAHPG